MPLEPKAQCFELSLLESKKTTLLRVPAVAEPRAAFWRVWGGAEDGALSNVARRCRLILSSFVASPECV
jgi:hypothetical protein